MPAHRSQQPLFATALPRLILSAALVALGACDGSDSPVAPQSESEPVLAAGGAHLGGRIVFAAGGDLYTMSADGTRRGRPTECASPSPHLATAAVMAHW